MVASEVPKTFAELEALPGVGHKTASVVMSQAFGVPAFPVDTHIHRLAERGKLSDGRNVEQTERDLKKLFPEAHWNQLPLRSIFYGREYCTARGCVGTVCEICRTLFPGRKALKKCELLMNLSVRDELGRDARREPLAKSESSESEEPARISGQKGRHRIIGRYVSELMSVLPNTCSPHGSPVFRGPAGPSLSFEVTAGFSLGCNADSFTGLPLLGHDESLFHASFRIITEGNLPIEGVVAACNPQQAGSRLLAAEAQLRQVSYDELFRASSFPEAWRVSPGEALELVPRPSAVMVLLPAQTPRRCRRCRRDRPG